MSKSFKSLMHSNLQVRIKRGLSTWSSGTRNRSVSDFSEVTLKKPNFVLNELNNLEN